MTILREYKPPFPWFGGKSRVAAQVWDALGNVPNYVEPFFGSGAVLFLRPHAPQTETVNDKDALLANFWRALQADPDEVAHWANWPANENDLHARHAWLVAKSPQVQTWIEGDPDFYNAKIAGWWVWGLCLKIGSGWCSGQGPWQSRNGELLHLGDAGQGIHRGRLHLGNAGRGIHRGLLHLGNAGRGIREYLHSLAERLRSVRVASGDWARVLTPSVTEEHGLTGVFLDPPYSHDERGTDLYREESDCAADVRAWAIEHGENTLYRIVLCGYEGEHTMPDTWETIAWKANGGHGSQGNGRGRENASRERLWLSPHCVRPTKQLSLLA